MRIRFLNPVEQVTGSCYWLRDDERDVEFLVDCGMMQGEPGEREWNSRPFEFVPAKLRCVFLTHAHIDHCGLLPRLAKEGFRGPVYCTRESADLARVSLADAARLPGALYGQDDVKRLDFREPAGQVFGKLHPFGTDLFFGCYRSAHVIGAVAFRIVWGPMPLADDTTCQNSITFSGDLGCNVEGAEHHPLLRHRMAPPPADYAVVESTYGATVRPPEEQDFHARLSRLQAAIDRGLFDRRGVVLIPCFAIDRTQTVLFDLHHIFRADPERYARVGVYLNAPMAADVNGIYAKALQRKEPTKAKGLKSMWLNKRLFEWLDFEEQDLETYLATMLSCPLNNAPHHFDKATNVIEWRERPFPGVIYSTYTKPVQFLIDRPETAGPSIVVTGSGMCNGGMVLAYLEAMLRRESTTMLFTGYLSPSTIGGKLLALAKLSPEDRLRVSETIEWDDPNPRKPPHSVPLSEVTAQFEQLPGYSAHADQRGLLEWLFSSYRDQPNLAGRTIFITHGAEHQRRALQAAIQAKSADWEQLYPERHQGVTVHLPRKRGGWFDLDAGKWLQGESESDSVVELLARVGGIEQRLATIEETLRRIETKMSQRGG